MLKNIKFIKNGLILLVVSAVILSCLVSCGKSENVKTLELQIAEANITSFSDENELIKLEENFKTLTKREQSKVQNADLLTDYRNTMDGLHAEEVVGLIDKIGSLDALNLINKKSEIDQAQKAYDALTSVQQSLVTNVAILKDAMPLYEESKVKFDEDSAKVVINKIDNLGKITIESKSQVIEVRKDYNDLSNDAQTLVDNLSLLEAAEQKIGNFEVEVVINHINSLGIISLQSGKDIEAIDREISLLDSKQKSLITNYNTFTNKKNQYDNLKKQESIRKEREKAKSLIRVSRVSISNPDSVGGVELYLNFTNKSAKTIKYIDFGVSFYNNVGDIVRDWRIDEIVYCRATGPYAQGEGLTGTQWYWGKYYSWDIKRVRLVSLDIEYMDGTRSSVSKDLLDYIQY